MVHETSPGPGRTCKKLFPSIRYFLSDFQAGILTGEGDSVKCAGFCVKYLLLDWMWWAKGILLESLQQVEGWIRSFWLTCFKWILLLFYHPQGCECWEFVLPSSRCAETALWEYLRPRKSLLFILFYSFYVPAWFVLAHVVFCCWPEMTPECRRFLALILFGEFFRVTLPPTSVTLRC